MMLRDEHSSIYMIVEPLEPKVTFVGCVNRTDVSEGIIMICADWMKVKLIVSLDIRQTSKIAGYFNRKSLISNVISLTA